MNNTKRLSIVGLGALAVAAVTSFIAYSVVKSRHAEYARETLALLPRAEEAYAQGRFAEAPKTAADASKRFADQPTWFEPGDEGRIRDLQRFLDAQLALWTEAERLSAETPTDPAKARAGLEALVEKARAGAAGTRPLLDHVDPFLQKAAARECETVEMAGRNLIPAALKAYELGRWDDLLMTLDTIRKTVATLPPASRQTVEARMAQDLKPVDLAASLVGALRAVQNGKEEGSVKADLLREQIRGLADPKGRDTAFRKELLKAIAAVDPETRAQIAGTKIEESAYGPLKEAFLAAGDLVDVGDPKDTSVIELQGPVHRYAIRVINSPPQGLFEVDRVRILFPTGQVHGQEQRCLEIATQLSRELRAARPSRLFADEPWVIFSDAPGRCGVNISDKDASFMIDGRLFTGTVAPDEDPTQQIEAFRAAAGALEAAVLDSSTIPAEIKGPLGAFLKATYTRAPPNDHLDDKFCREAVYYGYIETQLPNLDAAVADRLKEYRKVYEELARLRPRIEGAATDKAAVVYRSNIEGEGQWRLVDPVTGSTTFSLFPRDQLGASLVVQEVFKGVFDEIPADVDPIEVRMTNAAGTLSSWTAASDKLEFDVKVWNAALDRDGKQIPEVFVSASWQVPPHAVVVDGHGRSRWIILPAGPLKVEDFQAIPPGPKRREAQDRFLQLCADRMRTPGELHLMFRYIVQYVLDSPVMTATTLIGSSKFSGDVHQDAYQTLDRIVNGRYLADCDDLAELYWTILRKQGRLAHILGVPGHATCGVAEKDGDEWIFFCVDTGPARQIKAHELDEAVEKLVRTYDTDGSLQFDPRQVRFLFRFAGEQTRTDYWLDDRILRDAEYADLMIRVQGYWHFRFYALGIETMEKVLQTDKMPANCTEISGLYERIGMYDKSLEWVETGIRGLDPKDTLSRLDNSLHVFTCYREMNRKDEAFRTVKAAADEVQALLKSDPKESDRYRTLKFQLAQCLASIDRPFEAWSLVAEEVAFLVSRRAAAQSLMHIVVDIYSRMGQQDRSGATLTDDQKNAMKSLGAALKKFFASGLFKSDDSIVEIQSKYGMLYDYQVALLGNDGAVAELVKNEFPKKPRQHTARKNASAELDWAWIRVSPISYTIASSRALDKDDPTAGGPQQAIAIIRALEAALPEIRRQGSAGPIEFMILEQILLRSCLEMDEKGIRGVFDEMKRQAWGKLYQDLSQMLGAAADRMSLEDFEKVFKIYCEYQAPRQHYYQVVYEAFKAGAKLQALAASRICRRRFPDDADMKREHELLEKLAGGGGN